MKKFFLIPLFIMALMNVLVACSDSDNNDNGDDNKEEPNPVVPGNGKMLIVYFSYPEPDGVDASSGASRLVIDNKVVGSMQFLASIIQEATGADVFRIETVQQYPASHAPLIAQAQDELNNRVRPALKTRIANIDQYDTIFIGYPNWWGNLPAPLYTFLESYDFTGKTIVPFNSHGGSGFSNTINTIKDYQSGATITSGFTVSRDIVGQAKDNVIDWLKSLNIINDEDDDNKEEPNVPTDTKMLITYFSYPEPDGVDASTGASRLVIDNKVVGSMQFLANVIEKATGADVFRIETVQQYPASHAPLIAQAQEELNNGVRPALKTRIEDLDKYDIIFIGYPNWWGNLPAPLYTFLESYDFAGKTIIPFNSHGGSGFSNTINTIRGYQPEATIASGFSVSRNTVGQSENDVVDWLKRLEIIK